MKDSTKAVICGLTGFFFGVGLGIVLPNKTPQLVKGNSVIVSEVKVKERNTCTYTLSQPNGKGKMEKKVEMEHICGVHNPTSELLFCTGYKERR